MKPRGKHWTVVVVGLIVLAMPAAVTAQSAKVLNVIAVKVKGDEGTYLKKVKQLDAAIDRLKTGGTIRVWRAALAGDNVGTIFVAVEHANLEAYAKATTKLEADAQWQKLIKDLNKSGIRKIVGNSLLVEITP
ncbi:MAG: hypothetical protein ACE5I7_18885 [Candidatus Binatia bacterium]